MNACAHPRPSHIASELDGAVAALLPAAEDLLTRVTGVEPRVIDYDPGGIRLASPLEFPDHIGEASVRVELFRYREDIRLDLQIVHNRTIARVDGTATDRNAFMNDFVASVSLAPGSAEIPESFIRHVVAGVAAAKDGVRRHNRRYRSAWNELQVAAMHTPEPEDAAAE